MTKGSFELSIAVPSGKGLTKIREYGLRGSTYVEGRKGQKFVIQFRNNTAARVLAIPSVDGICILDGKPATSSSQGYVVPGYRNVDFTGWRTSLSDVAEFVFETKDKSYSAVGSTASVENCGVVGVRVFSEKTYYIPPPIIIEKPVYIYPQRPRPHFYEPFWCSDTGSTTSRSMEQTLSYSASSGEASEEHMSVEPQACFMNNVSTSGLSPGQIEATAQMNLGAGWGDQKVDIVTSTTFERDRELDTLIVYFSDEIGLRAAGIDVGKSVCVTAAPQAFGGFCQPPKK